MEPFGQSCNLIGVSSKRQR